jgi:hypothetical protein
VANCAQQHKGVATGRRPKPALSLHGQLALCARAQRQCSLGAVEARLQLFNPTSFESECV